VVAALVTSLLVLGLASTGTTAKFLAGSGLVLMLASVAAVGLLVAWHQPGNPIGWLLLSSSVCFLLTFNAGSYARSSITCTTAASRSARRFSCCSR
jgi:thiosulfate reductase cytochrome b subunit